MLYKLIKATFCIIFVEVFFYFIYWYRLYNQNNQNVSSVLTTSYTVKLCFL